MSPSRRSGGGQGSPISLSVILALVFPAMIAAALALAYYGYRYIEDVSRSFEASFREASRTDVQRAISAVEARIDEEAWALFAHVELDEDQPALSCDVPAGGAVAAYVVFDVRDICTNGKQRQSEWKAYTKGLDRRSLAPGAFRYIHRQFDSGYALIGTIRKQTDTGHDYYIAARIDDAFIRTELERALAQVKDERKLVSVLDEQGRLIAGAANTTGTSKLADRFLFEAPLGKTLYAWRVRVAPVDVQQLQAQAARQRVVGPLLVIFATSIISIGLVIVWLAVRAERRASRLKSDFIANVSHELKTPLSLIRMFGEMVATGRHKGEDAAREYGAIITRESERLSHLIDNVLDFARLERGKASYHFAEGDVADVVERALDVCRFRLEKEKMRLVTNIEPSLPLVRMDDNAMTLVVLNLVDNAIKYAAEGGEVQVTLQRSPGGIMLGVRDNGPGVASDEQRRVFERFYRARGARDGNVRGSGIGLSLVKYIAEAHGGRVTLESPVSPVAAGRNPGTAFRVYLPAPIAEGSESAERHEVHTKLAALREVGRS